MTIATSGEFEHLCLPGQQHLHGRSSAAPTKQEKEARLREQQVYEVSACRSTSRISRYVRSCSCWPIHRPEHGRQRHRRRPHHAAAEERPLGPGDGHHPQDQGSVDAPQRQRGAGGADRGDRVARKLELESQQQIEELAPLRSELIQVNYAKAADFAALKSPRTS